MKLLKTITENDFGRPSSPDKWSEFRLRKTVKAILLNEKNEIAITYPKNPTGGFYRLLGGGLEPGEDNETALRRELIEEAGAYNVEILQEIGSIDEYREEWGLKLEQTCYLCKLTSEIGTPLEDTDIRWLKNIEEVISLAETGATDAYDQDFEKLRDLLFLKEALTQIAL